MDIHEKELHYVCAMSYSFIDIILLLPKMTLDVRKKCYYGFVSI